ncbi:hypothetical protein C8R43DRAFT_982611 [Mycena crocata]|nr:hypothetical protein C8R43DRAFT_982611 [Mycena crocata]
MAEMRCAFVVWKMRPPSPITTFQLVETPWDPRGLIPAALLLTLLSPLGFTFLSYWTCLGVFATYWGLPPLLRLRWPTLMETNILDDLRINAGGSVSLFASVTALLLQVRGLHV